MKIITYLNQNLDKYCKHWDLSAASDRKLFRTPATEKLVIFTKQHYKLESNLATFLVQCHHDLLRAYKPLAMSPFLI